MRRRDVLVGGAALAAAGASWMLAPRETLDLMGRAKLAEIVPDRFGAWTSELSDKLVQPKTRGKLADLLYSDTLSRIYRRAGHEEQVMMLIAYGSTQSDLLQLHRPETCYPAFGYRIARNEQVRLKIGEKGLPAREMLAVGPGRSESILYWTRIGDALPTDGGEQRLVRLRMAMAGYVPDGLLARFSIEGQDTAAGKRLAGFVQQMLGAVAAEKLPALIGRAHHANERSSIE